MISVECAEVERVPNCTETAGARVLNMGIDSPADDGDVFDQPGALRRSIGLPQLRAVNAVVAAEEEGTLKRSGDPGRSGSIAEGDRGHRLSPGLRSVAPPESPGFLPVRCEEEKRSVELAQGKYRGRRILSTSQGPHDGGSSGRSIRLPEREPFRPRSREIERPAEVHEAGRIEKGIRNDRGGRAGGVGLPEPADSRPERTRLNKDGGEKDRVPDGSNLDGAGISCPRAHHERPGLGSIASPQLPGRLWVTAIALATVCWE